MHSNAGYLAAMERMKSAPLTSNNDDFAQLGAVSPTLMEPANQLRQMAAVPHERTPRLETKSDEAPATIAAFLERHGKKSVTYKALHESLDMLLDVLKQHKEKIETFRQRNDMLDARVRELEARPLLK